MAKTTRNPRVKLPAGYTWGGPGRRYIARVDTGRVVCKVHKDKTEGLWRYIFSGPFSVPSPLHTTAHHARREASKELEQGIERRAEWERRESEAAELAARPLEVTRLGRWDRFVRWCRVAAGMRA